MCPEEYFEGSKDYVGHDTYDLLLEYNKRCLRNLDENGFKFIRELAYRVGVSSDFTASHIKVCGNEMGIWVDKRNFYFNEYDTLVLA